MQMMMKEYPDEKIDVGKQKSKLMIKVRCRLCQIFELTNNSA